jgi:hypothetical protein
VPFTALLILFAIPIASAIFFGVVAMRGETPNVYQCARCGHDWRRAPHKPYPDRCPACDSSQWSA